MVYLRRARYLVRKWARQFLRGNDSPRQIAGGIAIGTFVAFNPIIGSQMLAAAILATIFRCSRLPAIAMVYVTNPLTAVPLYGGAYAVGAWACRLFGFDTLKFEQVKRVFAAPEHMAFWSAIREKAVAIGALGWAGLVPMEVGATLTGLAAAAAMYYVTLRFVTGHRLLKAQRMALRAQKRLEAVRQKLLAEQAAQADNGAPHD